MTNAYDQVHYPGQPYAQAHPAYLGVYAKLFGLPFAPFEACRMLEIGCGDGVNLIALALTAPSSRFVGVDLAEAPIARARADAKACGCDNVEFHAMDLRDIGAEFGEFDYIAAHGVLAWVPEAVRAALLPVIGARLAPHGLAMVSFVALPGGRAWQAMRDMLLFETREARTPAEKLRLAIGFIEANRSHWERDDCESLDMRAVAKRILDRAPDVLFHDELGEFYAPQLFSDVAAAAAAAGMTYLADSRAHLSEEALFPPEGAVADWTRRQQELDFQKLRSFHNAIFCRGAPDRRRVAERLKGLWAHCDVSEGQAPEPGQRLFVTGQGLRITTNDPRLGTLLEALARAYPQAVELAALPDLDGVAEAVFKLFVSQALSLTTAPQRLVRVAGERPLASPLARLQAARGEANLATPSHAVLRIDDPALTKLLIRLDGVSDRATLARELADDLGLDAHEAAETLERALATLAAAAVMMG